VILGGTSSGVFEVLGAAGIAISMLAYLPQVVHLAREHCSAGISRRAWVMWLVSSQLIGSLALHRHDPVFVLLQISSLISAAAILFLAHRYRGMICEAHMSSIPERWIGTDIVETTSNPSFSARCVREDRSGRAARGRRRR
jgi:lipid-A-disaccharide synthase-like uncharacterized protein